MVFDKILFSGGEKVDVLEKKDVVKTLFHPGSERKRYLRLARKKKKYEKLQNI